jgi:hypothetical protein
LPPNSCWYLPASFKTLRVEVIYFSEVLVDGIHRFTIQEMEIGKYLITDFNSDRWN